MFENVKIVIKEVDQPFDLYCKSGHVAPKTFRREGEGSEATPTRFFQVAGAGYNVDGCYCEPCLMVANYLGSKKGMI